MRNRRAVLGFLILSVLTSPAIAARQRSVRPGPSPNLNFTVTMPADERLATGIGIGILYDPVVLKFVDVTQTAAEALSVSRTPEIVIERGQSTKEMALVRMAWVSMAGQFAPALHGGPLATVQFLRLSDVTAEIRVVSLTADSSHAITPSAMSISSDRTEGRLALDVRQPREIRGNAAWSAVPTALPAGQCTPDVDGNGRPDALTDGVILLRYLFGFSGNALTSGAIGTGATRTTPADIKAFIDQTDCLGFLDADQSGVADALTDGIVLLRHLFGFSGSELVAGALAPGAGRTSADALITAIESYTLPRSVLVNGASVSSGGSIRDASGDFTLGAVGGDLNVTLTQGSDYEGHRTVTIARTGTGQLSVVLPPAEAAPPAGVPTTASSGFARIGTHADVASYEWDDEAGFGNKWFYSCGYDNRLPESVQQATAPILTSDACMTPFNSLHLSQYRAATLMSACSSGSTSCYEAKTAVLFVHGYSPLTAFTDFGGGSGTWGTLPSLVKAAGYVPFEFRWITAARFDDAAVDLAAAIRTVAGRTGRQVHVVAHSFGGLLVRQLLQSSAASSVAPYIASVVSLGTPHSGIASQNICPAPASVPVPVGSDNSVLGACRQISCYQAGFSNLNGIRSGAASTIKTVYELNGDAGYLIGRLSQTVSSLPAVDWLALLGIVSDDHIFSATTFDTGDNLISYSGQRFRPSMSLGNACPGSATATPLSTAVAQGSARLWERVLGFTGQPVPGGVLTTATDPAYTAGYAHNGSVTLNRRTEAKVDCATVQGCMHDTVRYLFGTGSDHSLFGSTSWLAAHGGTAVASETITFSVTVLDAVTRVPVSGAVVNVYARGNGPRATTNSLGQATLSTRFEPNLSYELRIRATGYVSLQDSFPSAGSRNVTPTNLGTRFLVPQSAIGFGNLAGTVQNATTGVGIANAAVTVRRSDRYTVDFSGLTNAGGNYDAGALPAGTYVVAATAAGFAPGNAEVTVSAAAANVGNLPLSPLLAQGQARIVLTWSVDPRDLDSHLSKVRSTGTTEYHIYYVSRFGTNGDNLDVDDQYSYGPETVTIQSIDPTARYSYWVHLYAGFGTIAGSPARVTVTTSAGTVTFNAPSSATGLVWNVFDIVNGQVIPCSGSCSVAPLGTGVLPAKLSDLHEQ